MTNVLLFARHQLKKRASWSHVDSTEFPLLLLISRIIIMKKKKTKKVYADSVKSCRSTPIVSHASGEYKREFKLS